MAHAAKVSAAQHAAVNSTVQELMSVIQKRRSVRVYKTGKVGDEQLNTVLEAARWAPSGANTQPWEFVVTRDRKKMKLIRGIYDNEWRQRKREDPVNYKGLKKDYVGDVSVIVLACGDPRTKAVYLTTRQQADREKLFQASIANAVQQMMLAAGEHESRHRMGFRARRSGTRVEKIVSGARAAASPLGSTDRPRSAVGRKRSRAEMLRILSIWKFTTRRN